MARGHPRGTGEDTDRPLSPARMALVAEEREYGCAAGRESKQRAKKTPQNKKKIKKKTQTKKTTQASSHHRLVLSLCIYKRFLWKSEGPQLWPQPQADDSSGGSSFKAAPSRAGHRSAVLPPVPWAVPWEDSEVLPPAQGELVPFVDLGPLSPRETRPTGGLLSSASDSLGGCG